MGEKKEQMVISQCSRSYKMNIRFCVQLRAVRELTAAPDRSCTNRMLFVNINLERDRRLYKVNNHAQFKNFFFSNIVSTTFNQIGTYKVIRC